MAPEMLERLFQPFTQAESTLDRSKGGLGLGLALVKGLVELHGGEVRACSPGLGLGAQFTVELPLLAEEHLPQEPAPTPSALVRRRILVVEDNRDAADSLRELLELENQQVVVAYSGPDGVAAARELRPDLILCDIGLPGMSGFEVARALRAIPALDGAWLVALSGYALPEDLERAREAGFDRHLAKPPSFEKLRHLLASTQRRSPPATELPAP
jgi:CheY-like chemotaxis protein